MTEKKIIGLSVDEVMGKAKDAAESFRELNQEQTDRIVKAVYEAGFNNRVKLAKLACDETRLGVWEDKVMKNVIATRYVYHDIKDLKTVGVISEDKEHEVVEIAEPLGPIFALTPITNPTSTVLFKILISLKTRNPIIIRPHGAARKCSIESARICYEAALKAGAPDNCIQWVKRSSNEQTRDFMSHRKTALVLATGSVNLVREAYRSGNPAIGVGPGNVPVYIGRTADIPFAVEQIFVSKTFDNGTVCASEQALIANRDYVDEVINELKKRNAYFLTKDETELLEKIAYNKEQMVMNAGIIGQPATVIAKMAGFEVPHGTALLIAELDDVGLESPLSLEILAPILAFYIAVDFEHAIDMCRKINVHGGMGHTVSIFSNDEEKIEYFASVMNAGRILVNTPASHGALGGTYNALRPSLVLACGTGGKNITTDNISAKHLLNIHRVARRKVSDSFVCDHYNYLDETKDAQSVDKECTKHET